VISILTSRLGILMRPKLFIPPKSVLGWDPEKHQLKGKLLAQVWRYNLHATNKIRTVWGQLHVKRRRVVNGENEPWFSVWSNSGELGQTGHSPVSAGKIKFPRTAHTKDTTDTIV
jgi:hypothetical protein